MQKNELYPVICEDITNQGYGIVHIDAMTVFVFGLLPGEKAKIRILKVLSRYAFGKIEERYTSSAHRQEPVCPAFGKCGGCAFLHMEYSASLKVKQDYVQSLFDRARLPIKVEFPLFPQDPYAYRNKAQFPVQVKEGKVQMGFYRPHSHDVINCPKCMIQSDAINHVYQTIRQKIQPEAAAGLRHVLIRSNRNNKIQIVWIGSENRFQTLSQELVATLPQIVSIVFNKNTRKDNVILGETYEVLYGTDFLVQECRGLQMDVHFKSFYQVNPVMMEVLYQTAIDLADLQDFMHVVDLYSGTGTISCLVSRHVQSVIGVEIVEEAVQDAKRNALRNHLDNVEFVCEDAGVYARKHAQKTDVLFVDPPRKGLSIEATEHIQSFDPDKIIYISCNPNTLVRDAKRLQEAGYACQRVQPVDMFCQTAGLECVSLFVKR